MSRCVIVGGAEIRRYDRINAFLRPDDFGVFCDGGLKHLPHLRLTPGLIVGDFDSYARPETAVETIVLPREKDDTDTKFGLREGLKRGYEEFLMIGVIGGRPDHMLANVYLLLYLNSLGKRGRIVCDDADMEIVSRGEAEIPDNYSFFSLLNISGLARGIRITGAKYPLENTDFSCEDQYGVSNEVLPGQTARVSLREGCLLLIRDF